MSRHSHRFVQTLVICLVVAFAGPSLAATIVHRFDFEDESGDDSVGGLAGDLIGDPSFSADTPSGEKAVVLEGGQYVRVDDEMDFGSEFSIAMWILPDTSALGIQNLIANAPGGWDTDGFKLFYNTWSDPSTADGAFILETGDGTAGLVGEAVSTGAGTIVDDEWTHVGVTVDVDNAEVWMYVNGELTPAPGGLNLAMKTDSPFEIGRMLNGWDMHGMMDDVQVYDGVLTDEEMAWLFSNPGSAIGLNPSVPGDFDGDQLLTAADIDQLTSEVRLGTNDTAFDLTSDGLVNDQDRTQWVSVLKNTYFGDANLDLEFNSTDLVAVLASGTYEADVDATWATGDFTGDGRTNSSDLVLALADGGYEVGPRAAVQAVPEPSALVLLAMGLLLWYPRRK